MPQHDTMQYCTALQDMTQHGFGTTQHSKARHDTIQAAQRSDAKTWHSTASLGTTQNSMAWHGTWTIQHSMAAGMIRNHTAQHAMARHGTQASRRHCLLPSAAPHR